MRKNSTTFCCCSARISVAAIRYAYTRGVTDGSGPLSNVSVTSTMRTPPRLLLRHCKSLKYFQPSVRPLLGCDHTLAIALYERPRWGSGASRVTGQSSSAGMF
jgi:hypothetical protein